MTYDEYRDIMDLDRPVSGRTPMSRENRAKQFAPFAALNGYEDAVRLQEILYDERPILSDEMKDEIDRKLRLIRRGDEISVTWFRQDDAEHGRGHYVTTSGIVRFFDPAIHLRVDDTEIQMKDIIDIGQNLNFDKKSHTII